MSSRFKKQDYIDYIKLMTTGDILESDLPDESIGKYVDQALIQIQQFIDETKLVTVPFAKCIDLEGFDHSAIVNVYRVQGFTGDTTVGITTSDVDPLYAQTWSVFTTGGTMYNLQNYVMNYLSYNTLLQMRNTLSTDLDFKEDKHGNKLYINAAYTNIEMITIEYIPIFHTVEDVTSDYWIDKIKRLALALVKIALGRIRTRYTQSNSLWPMDGEKMLEEGTTDYKELMETLRVNAVYFYTVD